MSLLIAYTHLILNTFVVIAFLAVVGHGMQCAMHLFAFLNKYPEQYAKRPILLIINILSFLFVVLPVSMLVILYARTHGMFPVAVYL